MADDSGDEGVARYSTMGERPDGGMCKSNRNYSPQWSRAEDNRLRELLAKHAKCGDEGMPHLELAELRDLDARSTRFIQQGLRDMEVGSGQGSPQRQDRQLLQLGLAVRRLGWDLLQRLLQPLNPGNPVAAPLHCLALLILAAEGARGDAAQELKARCGALRLGGLKMAARIACEVQQAVGAGGGVEHSAVAWLRQGMQVAPEFRAAGERGGCELRELVSAAALNDWARAEADQQGSIGDSMAVFSANVILAAALRLNCAWLSHFPVELTASQPFRLTPAHPGQPCMLMHARGGFDYAELPGRYAAVRIPFAGSVPLEAFVILPGGGSGLSPTSEDSPPAAVAQGAAGASGKAGRTRGASFFQALDKVRGAVAAAEAADNGCGAVVDLIQHLGSSGGWEGLTGALKRHDGELWLPRFHCSIKPAMRHTLSEEGCPTAFTTAADFAGLSAEPGVYIDDVHCLVNVAVDERGITAGSRTPPARSAAATAPPGARRFQMRCDRPFLFVVAHPPSGAVVLAAVITEPDPPPVASGFSFLEEAASGSASPVSQVGSEPPAGGRLARLGSAIRQQQRRLSVTGKVGSAAALSAMKDKAAAAKQGVMHGVHSAFFSAEKHADAASQQSTPCQSPAEPPAKPPADPFAWFDSPAPGAPAPAPAPGAPAPAPSACEAPGRSAPSPPGGAPTPITSPESLAADAGTGRARRPSHVKSKKKPGKTMIRQQQPGATPATSNASQTPPGTCSDPTQGTPTEAPLPPPAGSPLPPLQVSCASDLATFGFASPPTVAQDTSGKSEPAAFAFAASPPPPQHAQASAFDALLGGGSPAEPPAAPGPVKGRAACDILSLFDAPQAAPAAAAQPPSPPPAAQPAAQPGGGPGGSAAGGGTAEQQAALRQQMEALQQQMETLQRQQRELAQTVNAPPPIPQQPQAPSGRGAGDADAAFGSLWSAANARR